MNKRKAIGYAIVLFAILAGIGYGTAQIGRFTPTHAIVEPVYCGSCHPDQIRELNATTHLPHFAGAVYEQAEAVMAGGAAEPTQAEAISGGCMMCHNNWNNRENVVLNGFELQTDVNNGTNYMLKYNDIGFNPDPVKGKAGIVYNVIVPNASALPSFVRLGGNISKVSAKVQNPGTSGLAAGTALINGSDFNQNSTGIFLLAGVNTSLLTADTGAGSLTVSYTVNSGSVVTLKDAWGQLSALSPTPGYFFDDKSGAASCGNSEKGVCHAVEISVGDNVANKMPENRAGVNGVQLGSGNGIYFQHDMAYTSAEYAAKQVKLCAACHINKLPPMDADGIPIRQEVGTERLIRASHGTLIIDTQNLTTVSSDWAHKQVQCIRCHSHAGIGGEEAITGVRSP